MSVKEPLPLGVQTRRTSSTLRAKTSNPPPYQARRRELSPQVEDARKDRASLIERQAILVDISGVAGYLQEHLGQNVTAYLSGVKDSKLVGQWAAGRVQPRPLSGFRLRSAYQAARYLVEAYGSKTAQAWFFGRNSQLDGQAPASVLREGTVPDDWGFVVTAAKAFVETVP
jgi:hypothetical protein